MHDEPLIFVADGDAPSHARLLFLPRRLDSVRNHATGLVYEEGADFTVDDATGQLTRVPGSRMPVVSPSALAADDHRLMHERLVSVTYAHDHAPVTVAPSPATRTALTRTHERLRRREPLALCLIGDSISEGYDASGFHRVPPHQPSYASLVAVGLEQRHRGEVRLRNLAVAGSSAADGRCLSADIAVTEPDLLIVAYGMNDAGWASPEDYAGNIAAIVRDARVATPNVEVLLVASMRPTPLCHWVLAERFSLYRDALAGFAAQEQAALADVTSAWDTLLTRKSPYDLTANGLNHPNDFGHRIYAQTVLGCLSPDTPST